MRNHKQINFCSYCGSALNQLPGEICPSCGERVSLHRSKPVGKVGLLLVTFFLGWIGGHKFYLAKYGQGILYLLFCWSGIPAVLALIEFVFYAVKSEKELRHRYPVTSPAGLGFAIAISVVLMVFIGLFAAIAIPQYADFRQRGYDNVARSDLKLMKTCFDLYFAEENHYPMDMEYINACGSQLTAGVETFVWPTEQGYLMFAYHKRSDKAYKATGEKGPEPVSRDTVETDIASKFRIVKILDKFSVLAN